MSGQLRWVVVRTKSHRESWAAENVARQGYPYYFPKISVLRKRLARAEPLFACYLFVQTDGPWRFLLGTFGVAGVVLFADQPALVSNKTIEDFKAREVDGCVELPAPPQARFQVGQQLRVKSGMFSGCYGVYEGLDPKERERILLEFLGRKVPVLLAPELLEAA